MSVEIQDWIADAKGRDILDAAGKLKAALKRQGVEHVGPCPLGCTGGAKRKGGHDGFAVNTRKQMFICRPGSAGGTVIDMVMHVMGLEFLAACEWLNGTPPPGRKASPSAVNAEPPAPRDDKAAAEAENVYRATEIRKARAIFAAGAGPAGTLVELYLAARGITLLPSGPLKFAADLPYWHTVRGARSADVIWRGPAMLAAVTNDRGELTACHITWLDPAVPGKKATIADPDFDDALSASGLHERDSCSSSAPRGSTQKFLPAKKVRGSKRKGAIKLVSPPAPLTLFAGEGIETVASLYEWDGLEAAILRDAAYWSCIDLGQMGGKSAASVSHPSRKGPKGKPARVGGPWPEPQPDRDLDIPDSVTELVLLGDGDSDRFTTEMILHRAAARWAKAGRSISVLWAPPGLDFNDVIMGRAA